MKLKTILMGIFSLVLFTSSFAQFQYINFDHAQELSKRIILVELFDEISPEEIQTNEYIKNYFQKNLSIGKEVKCMSSSEINFLLDENMDKYAVISHGFDTNNIWSATRIRRADGGFVTADYHGPTFKEKHIMATLYHMDLTLNIYSDDEYLDGKVTEVDFIHLKLRPEDYVFAAQQFNRLYEASINHLEAKDYYDVTKAIENLKSKTLLLDKNNIEFDIKKAKGYSFDYKFVDYDVVKNAILEKKPGFAYALLIWSDQLHTYDWVVVDSETGEIYTQVTYGGLNVVGLGEDKPPYKIKKMHFKFFDSKFSSSINNRYN